jgi:hypothetical protein
VNTVSQPTLGLFQLANTDNTEDRVHIEQLTVLQGHKWSNLVLTLGLIALGMAIPKMGMPQAVTGPLVNALLLITVELMGTGTAALVGLTTPLSALAHGVLPLPLMVMIPFIGIANAVLSTVYGALRATNKWLALSAGAVLKFLWLYGVTAWLTATPLRVTIGGARQVVQLPSKLVTMMQWPQLLTAMVGGLVALGVTFGLKQLTGRIDR